MQASYTPLQSLPEMNGKIVPIRNWSRIRNNGDALTSFIVSRLLKGIPIYAPANCPHLLATGSILFMANSHSTIWGSGVLNKQAHLPQVTPTQVRALRGRDSADFLTHRGVRLGHLPFGDPGIFAADLINPRGEPLATRYKIAVVPHHDSVRHPLFAEAANRDDVCVVNILDDSLKPLEQIARSEVVISQSLHGLVYAESFAKPSLWISTRSDEIWNFKFHDWFTTVGNPQRTPVFMQTSLDSMVEEAERRYCTIDKSALLSAFPTDSVTNVDGAILDFETCRHCAPVRFFFADDDVASMGGSQEQNLERLSGLLTAALSEVFSGWAERTYSVAAKLVF